MNLFGANNIPLLFASSAGPLTPYIIAHLATFLSASPTPLPTSSTRLSQLHGQENPADTGLCSDVRTSMFVA